MVTSRNPQEFLERSGLADARVPPRPRLAIGELLVHTLPLDAPMPEQGVLEVYEGNAPDTQPVDRGAAKPWPNQVDNHGQEG
jgi:hypothetical protein